METIERARAIAEARLPGTYDFASPVERIKAIDQAMRQYFGADNWVAVRNKLFPGLRHTA